MTIPIGERRGFLIDCEPVCDHCGHGQGLHADAADVECVACVERGEALDCPRFVAVGTGWFTRPRDGGAPDRVPQPVAAGWR